MARGGARQPSSPAPVSGPGALSRRTDGGPGQPVRDVTGLPYGQAQQLQSIQSAAPMSATPGGNVPPPQAAAGGAPAGPPRVPFGAPTQQPNTPVTDGAALGPGAGLEALGFSNPQSDDLQSLVPYLPVFQRMANQPGSSKAARNLVRQVMAYAAGQG